MESKSLEFLKKYKSEATVRTYKGGIIHFLTFIYESDDEANADSYLSEERNIKEDVRNFIATITAKNTAKTRINALKVFFKKNNHDLGNFWDEFKNGERKETYLTHSLTPEQARKVVSYLDPKMRAFVLVQLSSGMRSGEMLQLTLDSIKWREKSTTILIPASVSKTRSERLVFITPEASGALKTWLTLRDDYIQSSAHKCRGMMDARDLDYDVKTEDDNRVFPFSHTTAIVGWRAALKKASLGGKGSNGMLKYRLHSLRRFFRTQLGLENPDIAEHLMGHGGYLSQYRTYSEEQLREVYESHCHVLTLFGSETLAEVKAEQEALVEKQAEIDKKMEETVKITSGLVGVMDSYADLKMRVKELEAERLLLLERLGEVHKNMGLVPMLMERVEALERAVVGDFDYVNDYERVTVQ